MREIMDKEAIWTQDAFLTHFVTPSASLTIAPGETPLI